MSEMPGKVRKRRGPYGKRLLGLRQSNNIGLSQLNNTEKNNDVDRVTVLKRLRKKLEMSRKLEKENELDQRSPQVHTALPNQTHTAPVHTSPLRRSPRKIFNMDEPLVPSLDENVQLMNNITVSRTVLRNAHQAALKHYKPAFTLMSKLLTGLFTTQELASSRGLGIGFKKPGDDRPALDEKRIEACKEYVYGWMMGMGLPEPFERELNSAVTQQTAYARKKLQKQQHFKQWN
ncbi:uncharacterized protein LOC128546310 [Mercenaria mercenaria]|uniref:uncharacterized protein LOC128546310 n=1 Tax=Mercenaria mercenaria TaxID=6596 RepID=UPI00234FAA40|nr:uncharacterized protein LOC128546310 [Mercenaria mercenaria]